MHAAATFLLPDVMKFMLNASPYVSCTCVCADMLKLLVEGFYVATLCGYSQTYTGLRMHAYANDCYATTAAVWQGHTGARSLVLSTTLLVSKRCCFADTAYPVDLPERQRTQR